MRTESREESKPSVLALQKHFAKNPEDKSERAHYGKVTRHLSEFFQMVRSIPAVALRIEPGYGKNTKIVEIGCRDALPVFALEDIFRSFFDYLCIEIDAKQVKKLQKRFAYNERLSFAAADASNATVLKQELFSADMLHPDFVLIRHPVVLGPHWLRFIPGLEKIYPAQQSRSYWRMLTGPSANYFNESTLIITTYNRLEAGTIQNVLCHASIDCHQMVKGNFSSSFTPELSRKRITGGTSASDGYYHIIPHYKYKQPTHTSASEVVNSGPFALVIFALAIGYSLHVKHGWKSAAILLAFAMAIACILPGITGDNISDLSLFIPCVLAGMAHFNTKLTGPALFGFALFLLAPNLPGVGATETSLISSNWRNSNLTLWQHPAQPIPEYKTIDFSP